MGIDGSYSEGFNYGLYLYDGSSTIQLTSGIIPDYYFESLE